MGRKAHWPWNLIDYPQPTTNMHWNPNCPLVGEKKKNPRENVTFYKQIPNSSMHIFSAITSFSVPMKGRPKPAHMYSYHCFLHCLGPLFLWPARLCHKHNKMDSCRCHLSWPGRGVNDQGQRKGRSQGHLRRGRPAFSSSPRVSLSQESFLAGEKIRDRWLSMLLYLAVYNSRLFLLWRSFLT